MIPRRRYEHLADVAAVMSRPGTAQSEWQKGVARRLATALSLHTSDSVMLHGSGRAAMLWVLEARGVAPGATVIVPAWTFAGVPRALRAAGYDVVFADVGMRAPAMTVQTLDRAWRPGVRAILLTHLFGEVHEPTAIARWAETRRVEVIEDCAHAAGSSWADAPVGTLGGGALYSLDVLKPIAALGGGISVVRDGQGARGAAVADGSNALFARKVVSALVEIALFQPRVVRRGERLAAGAGGRLIAAVDTRVRRGQPTAAFHNLQGRIATRQAASLPNRLSRRRDMAARVARALELDADRFEGHGEAQANAYFLILRAPPGDALRVRHELAIAGVDSGFGAAIADLLQPAATNAKAWAATALQLPCGAGYSEAEIQRLCSILRRFRGRLTW